MVEIHFNSLPQKTKTQKNTKKQKKTKQNSVLTCNKVVAVWKQQIPVRQLLLLILANTFETAQ